MFLSKFSVHHKITVLMMTLMIILFGAISFSRLGLDVMPDMEFPAITIMTTYIGASPEEIESLVTSRIEMSVSGVRHLKNIQSTSSENMSTVTLEFEWGTNLDGAAQDIRDAMDQISGSFPDGVGRPMVMKFGTSSMPVVVYGVTGMEHSHELRKLLEDDIANRLKRIDGVAMINVWGGDELEVHISVDRFKLEQYGVSFDDISTAIRLRNANISAGNITINQSNFYIRTLAEFKSIEEIKNIPVRVNPDRSIVRVRDLAEVIETPKEVSHHIRTNQRPTVAMIITKESGANTLTVSRGIITELARIEDSGQYDIAFHQIMNSGDMIESTVNSAISSLIIGAILAIITMFLFMRSLGPTFAVSLAIPTAVIATFIPMFLMDFSLNIMTLAGLILGVGMLVDNSIVVIDNVFRLIEEGSDRITAAVQGTKEVAMAITASTLTTIAVFIPMVFSSGMTSVLVRGLALTVSFSLLASLFVALTIVPTLASVLFSKNSSLYKKSGWFEWLKNKYIIVLKWCLANRGKTLLMVVLALIMSFWTLTKTGAEFMPSGDNTFVMMNIKMPIGSTLEETNAFVSQVETVFMQTPEIESFLVMVGSSDDGQSMGPGGGTSDQTEAQVWGKLVPLSQRDRILPEIMEYLRTQIPSIEGGEIAFNEMNMGGGGGTALELQIFGNDLEELSKHANQIALLMREVPNIRDVQNSMAERNPEIQFTINQDMDALYGVSATQIASTIRTAISGSTVGIFRTRGEEINIRLQYQSDQRHSVEDLGAIRINSPLGMSIPLNQLVTMKFGEGHSVIVREGQLRKATLTANILGSDLAGVTRELREKINPYIESMPSGYNVVIGGAFQDMVEGFTMLALALLLSLILIYMIMASQFESLKQPFIVMFTVPLCVIGVAFALFFTGHTLSILSGVGIIVLCGIIVNNAIVLIDYVNKARQSGIAMYEALIKAGNDRLRPILITSLSTITALIPMALSSAEGSEMLNPIAVVLLGGLLSATFFTLLVIPVIYSLFDKESKQKRTKI